MSSAETTAAAPAIRRRSAAKGSAFEPLFHAACFGAATALLVHVVSLDGEPTEVEKRKLHSLIESRFKLDPGTADKLIASATRVEGEAVDLYHFTSVIMRSVNEEGRLRIVEMMWELVYADGQVSEFEDNVVWRAADLLGVSSRDRIDLKHRVAGAQSTPVAGN